MIHPYYVHCICIDHTMPCVIFKYMYLSIQKHDSILQQSFYILGSEHFQFGILAFFSLIL